MKNTKKKLRGKSRVVKVSFSSSNITKYSGLNTVAKYMNKRGHQIKLKMYEHHFYKADWEELDRLIEAA